MRKLFLAFAMTVLASAAAQAQSPTEEHKFEVGGQLTIINLSPVETTVTAPIGTFTTEGLDLSVVGFGGRVGYNLNRYVGVEAEVNYLPEKNFNEVEQSRRTQVFAGVKAGKRWEKFGVFAKARPGAMHFEALSFHSVCGTQPGNFSCQELSQTNFAVDLGGVVEFYPSPRFIVRIDAGDTIIHFKDAGPTNFFNSSVFTPAATTHNFQASIGIGFRF